MTVDPRQLGGGKQKGSFEEGGGVGVHGGKKEKPHPMKKG